MASSKTKLRGPAVETAEANPTAHHFDGAPVDIEAAVVPSEAELRASPRPRFEDDPLVSQALAHRQGLVEEDRELERTERRAMRYLQQRSEALLHGGRRVRKQECADTLHVGNGVQGLRDDGTVAAIVPEADHTGQRGGRIQAEMEALDAWLRRQRVLFELRTVGRFPSQIAWLAATNNAGLPEVTPLLEEHGLVGVIMLARADQPDREMIELSDLTAHAPRMGAVHLLNELIQQSGFMAEIYFSGIADPLATCTRPTADGAAAEDDASERGGLVDPDEDTDAF